MAVKPEQIARQVVRTCLRIHEGDQVIIDTWAHTVELAEALALECYRVGAVPAITLFTDRLYREILRTIPEEHLANIPTQRLAQAEAATAAIMIGGPESPQMIRNIPGSRVARFGAAMRALQDRFYHRHIREAYLIIGLATPQRARKYGLNYAAWVRMIQAGMTVDYEEISRLGEAVGRAFEEGDELHITSASGTDLRLEIVGRSPYLSDGIIDEEEAAVGLNGTTLPAGDITVAPLERSAEGVLVYDTPQTVLGRHVEGLTLKFERGQIVACSAERNFAAFEECSLAATGEKGRIGTVSIGLNPKMRVMGYWATDLLACGAVSVSLGDNTHFGGTNQSSLSLEGTLQQATLEIDGEPVVHNGMLCVP